MTVEEMVERTLSVIFRDNLPLNPTSVKHHTQRLFPGLCTDSEIQEYMHERYGWNDDVSYFTSGERIQ